MRKVFGKAAVLLSTALLGWSGHALAHGKLQSLDALARIQPGVTKAAQVRELLGAPARTLRFPARGIEALEYDAYDWNRRMVVSIAVGSDGTVRDVQRIVQSIP